MGINSTFGVRRSLFDILHEGKRMSNIEFRISNVECTTYNLNLLTTYCFSKYLNPLVSESLSLKAARLALVVIGRKGRRDEETK